VLNNQLAWIVFIKKILRIVVWNDAGIERNLDFFPIFSLDNCLKYYPC